MTKSEMETYRGHLLALRDRVDGDMSQLAGEALRHAEGDAGGNLSSVPIHMADLGTDAFEQEFTLGLLQNERDVAGRIDAALERIAKGTFGRCEECGEAIPRQRLNALPYTPHCVSCARKQEGNS